MGIIETDHNQKLTCKHTALNKQAPPGVDHNNSMHTMSLQRSKYMCIDDNIKKEFVMSYERKK